MDEQTNQHHWFHGISKDQPIRGVTLVFKNEKDLKSFDKLGIIIVPQITSTEDIK